MTTQRAELGFENSDVHRDTCGAGDILGVTDLELGRVLVLTGLGCSV